MNNLLDELSKFSNLGASLSAAEVSYCLILAFILSLVVAKTYQITYRGVSFSPAFMHTLVICAMVIAAVMLIIGSNIARAFSLVGALSIIRFRNAVKDPRDVAYIFLAMGIGMACGTGFYRIGVVLTVIICLVSIIMSFTRFGERGLTERVLRIQTPQVPKFETVFNDVLAAHSEAFSLMSAETSRMGTELDLTFSLRVKQNFSSEKLINDLSKLNQNLKIQVLGSNHVIDL
jgi:uncharacterized membrane protein YhiD involved in acid resistance